MESERETERDRDRETERERENIQRQVTFTLEHQHHFVFSITDKGPQSLELPKKDAEIANTLKSKSVSQSKTCSAS